MLYTVQNIQKDVRIALDNNESIDALLNGSDEDTLMLNGLIRSKIEDAACMVEMSAPVHLLDSVNNFADAVFWDNDDHNTGWVILPDDFMRLMLFEMSDWKCPVHDTIDSSSDEYFRQRSDVKGVRGNCSKPVCAIVIRSVGKVMEFFSCNSKDAQVLHAVYLKKPEIDNYDCITICERCYRPFVYQCAGLVSQAIGKQDASTFFELSKGLII